MPRCTAGRAQAALSWQRAPRVKHLRSAATVVVTPMRASIRSVVTGAKRRTVYVYSSRKAGGAQPCESSIEVALVMRSEVDTAVADYQTQPHRLELTAGGDKVVYIPDLARDLADGSVEIIEVKDRFVKGEDPAYDWKLKAAAEVYRSMGFRFRLMRRSDVFLPAARVANAQAIQLNRHVAYDGRDVHRALCCVHANGGAAPLALVEEALGGGPRGRAVARALMVGRIVNIDLDRPLSRNSEVRLVEPAAGPGRLTFKLW